MNKYFFREFSMSFGIFFANSMSFIVFIGKQNRNFSGLQGFPGHVGTLSLIKYFLVL